MSWKIVNPGAIALLAVLVAPSSGTAQQGTQGGQVSGVVVEERSGRPLPNVLVRVDGTPLSARTDASGRFSFSNLTAADATLRATLIGYRPRTQAVQVGQGDLRIALAETAVQLDAIIVTGTVGGQQARALGNAVAMLQTPDVATLAPVADVQQLLSGRVAGVNVGTGQGNVGTGSVTRIRGLSTLSLTNEPLIYIDGARVDNNPRAGPAIRNGSQVSRINDITPAQIERIEIIKGPAAATLYGTEASAGVIQIITKKGVAGKAVVDATIKQGANWFMNPEGRLPVNYSRNLATGQLDSIDLYRQELDAGRPIFQTGHSQGYALGVRGGTETLRYYLGGDLDHDEGVVSYNWLNRLNTRVNLDVVPSDKVTVSSSVGFVRSKTRFAQAASGWGVIDQIIWGSPARLNTPTRGFLRVTPEAAGEIEALADLSRFTGSVELKYSPWGWLNHRLTVGGDVGDETNSILFPRHPLGSQYFFGALSLGDKTLERLRVTYTTVDYSSTASFDVTPNLNSATSAGAQYYTKEIFSVIARGRQFPAPPVETVGGAAVTTGSEDLIENKTLGLFAQQQLSWKNRLFLTGALRGDDNSAFGANFDFVTYPKLSASWVLTEEPFWSDVPLVNALRLRAAWGRAGQQPDVFAAIRLYEPTTGPGNVSTLTPQSLGNPDLKPEVGEELELGFDAGLLDDRVSLNLTYYSKKTKDAIVRKAVAPSVGFPGFQFVNLGELKNRGLEIGLDAQVLTGGAVAWDLGVTMSTNDNEVVSLGGLPPIVFGSQEHREGYPIGSLFYFKVLSAALDAGGNVVNALCDDGQGGQVPCAQAPRVFLGRSTPKLEASFTTTVTLWRGLKLYGLVDLKTGHMIENGDIGASHLTFKNSEAINRAADPILLAYDQFAFRNGASFMKAGFAKLREFSLGYTVPDRWIRRIGASSASISIAGRNLAILWMAQDHIFGRKVIDPEVRNTASELSAYIQTVLPQMASLVTTVRVTF